MSDKQYSPEEVLNLQSAAYQKGYNEGYQLGRYEEAQQVAVWVKGAPKERKQHYAKVPSALDEDIFYAAVIWPISDSDHWWCVGEGFKFTTHKDNIIAHIDEQATTSNKDEAVAFAEWIEQEGYYQIKSDKKWVHWGTIVAETTAQLHELWQQSKNKP